jgi:hypothetical protein
MKRFNLSLLAFATTLLLANCSLAQTNTVSSAPFLSCAVGNVDQLGSDKYFTMHVEAWKHYLGISKDSYGASLTSLENTRGYFISKEVLIKILCDSLGTQNEADGVIIHLGMETVDSDSVEGVKMADNKYVKRKMVPYISAAKLNKAEPRPVDVYGSLPVGLPLNFAEKENDPAYEKP